VWTYQSEGDEQTVQFELRRVPYFCVNPEAEYSNHHSEQDRVDDIDGGSSCGRMVVVGPWKAGWGVVGNDAHRMKGFKSQAAKRAEL
jgi:hypothetical protein